MIPIGVLLWVFLDGTGISHHAAALIIISVLFVLVLGLVIAAVCGYMAGLIGASNSPISGVGVIVVLAAALIFKWVTGGDGDSTALVAYTLFTAAIVFGVATISNDNLQDLKTGQLVGATPWKQQVALIFGVIFGSLLIPLVMDLMNSAFGFAGAPGAGENALAAPQAGLLSSVADGIFGDSLDWGLIGLGALIGAGVVLVDEILGRVTKDARVRLALPPLAVGMGMYLPVSLTLIIPARRLHRLVLQPVGRPAVQPRPPPAGSAPSPRPDSSSARACSAWSTPPIIAGTGDSDALRHHARRLRHRRQLDRRHRRSSCSSSPSTGG
jgi:putative OPT family oligopeptide transporter